MTLLGKVLFLAVVANPVASAVDCAAGSCPDETSLIQMKQVVKHADERIPSDGPVHDDKALIKGLSTKDGGQLDAALDSNIAKIKAEVEAKAADDIDFQDKTMNKQRKLQEAAQDKIDAIKKNYDKSVAHEDDKLKVTQAKRDAVKAAASKRVKDAKAHAEALDLKKEDAEDIAALGRQIGKEEGEDAEDHAWAEYSRDYQNSQDKKAREEEREAIDKQTTADRMDQADTKGLVEQLDGYVAQEKRDYQIAKADADADAHQQRYALSGPEGINNKVTSINADMDVKHYDRHASSSQRTIDKAAAGSYPAGDWPVGPGDGPAAASVRAESLAQIPNVAEGDIFPEHANEAIADSTPSGLDDGEVMDAFATNTDKTRSEIESKAASRITFANKERSARKASHEAAAAAVAADKKATVDAVAADKAAVAQTVADRKKVIDAAEQRVKDAKENARAHAIKRVQAQRAAALGRRVGTVEGRDAAKHAWADYKADVVSEKRKAAREAAREKVAAHEAAVRSAVEKKTAALKAADAALAARAKRAMDAAEARASAQAGVAEDRIEGDEGLKNRMTDVKADWAVKHYDRATDYDQTIIDEAAAGDWPAGDWPVGPGEGPGLGVAPLMGAGLGVVPPMAWR